MQPVDGTWACMQLYLACMVAVEGSREEPASGPVQFIHDTCAHGLDPLCAVLCMQNGMKDADVCVDNGKRCVCL